MSSAGRLRPFAGLTSRRLVAEEQGESSFEALAERLGSDQDDFDRRLKSDRVAERRTFLAEPRNIYGLESSQQDMVQAITQNVLQGMDKLLLDRQSEMLEAIMNITVEAPDLKPILAAVSRIDHGHSGKHTEVLEAITNIVVEQPDFTSIKRAIESQTDTQYEVMEAVRSIRIDAPDLAPIQRALQNLDRSDRHSEVLEAIASVASVDASLSAQKLERSLSALASEMRQDMAVLRQEILENRQETRSDAEVLLGELRGLPQAVAELKQAMRKIDQKTDLSEVLQAIRLVENDPHAIANAVHARTFKVDHSELVPHLRGLQPDHNAMASVFLERMKKTNFNVDHGEVLMALRKLKVPDHTDLANSTALLHEKHEELMKEMRRLKLQPDHSPLLSAIQSMEVDLSPVMDHVGAHSQAMIEELRRIRQPDHDHIADILHSRLRQSGLGDHSEVLDAIKQLNTQPDLSRVMAAINNAEVDLSPIHQAIGRLDFSVDHTPVLEEIRKVRDLHDMGPVLAAINQAEIDFSPVLEEITKINASVELAPVLAAIAELRGELLSANQVKIEPAQVIGSMTLPVQTIRSTVGAQVLQAPRIIEERIGQVTTVGDYMAQAPMQVVVREPSMVREPSQPSMQTVMGETYSLNPSLTPRSYTMGYASTVQGAVSPRPAIPANAYTIGGSLAAPAAVTRQLLGSLTAPSAVSATNLMSGSPIEVVGATDITLEGFDGTDINSAISPRRALSSPGLDRTLQRAGGPTRRLLLPRREVASGEAVEVATTVASTIGPF